MASEMIGTNPSAGNIVVNGAKVISN
jgi:hypothetical protein